MIDSFVWGDSKNKLSFLHQTVIKYPATTSHSRRELSQRKELFKRPLAPSAASSAYRTSPDWLLLDVLLWNKNKDQGEKKEAGARSFSGHICHLLSTVVFAKVIQIGHLARPQREEQCNDAGGIYKQQREQQQQSLGAEEEKGQGE